MRVELGSVGTAFCGQRACLLLSAWYLGCPDIHITLGDVICRKKQLACFQQCPKTMIPKMTP